MRLCKINRIFAKILENLTVDFSNKVLRLFLFAFGCRICYDKEIMKERRTTEMNLNESASFQKESVA